MKKGKAVTVIHNPILIGTACCVIFALALTAASAGLLKSEILPQDSIRITAAVCTGLAALLASLLFVRKTKDKKLLYAMGICLGYLTIMMISRLLFLRDGAWDVFPMLCSSAVGAICGGIWAAFSQKSRKRRRL